MGYLLAAGVAAVIVWLHGALWPGDPADASGGMAAFSDLLLFIGVFFFAAIPPTFLLLRSLRGRQWFWIGWSALSVLMTITGIIAGAVVVLPHPAAAERSSLLAMLAPLRVLAAAPLVIILLLSALLAPAGRARRILFACTGIEFLCAAATVMTWWFGSGS